MAVKKFSISIDEKTRAEAEKIVSESEGEFRNLSHFFDIAAKKLIKEIQARQTAKPVAEH